VGRRGHGQNRRLWPIGQQVGDFYGSWMNEAAIAAKGAAPLKPYLDRIAAVKDKGDLVDLFATVGYESPVGVSIYPDLSHPTQYAVYAGQSGLGMPNRDYYLLQGAKYDAYRAAYRACVTKPGTGGNRRRRGQGRPDHRARDLDSQGSLDLNRAATSQSHNRWTGPSSIALRPSSNGTGRWPSPASATSRRLL
jgi:hypothetical protein